MEIKELRGAIEAILFACGDAVAADRLASVLNISIDEVDWVCRDLADRLKDASSGLQLVRVDDKYQLCTVEKFAPQIRDMLDLRRNTPLSNAAMEVLAVIAYNEPVTKNFIERVRGVDCSGVVSSLVNKGLIEEAGRLEVPGRPMLYKTSLQFLRCFGMESLAQLPKLPGDLPGANSDEDGQISISEMLERSDEDGEQTEE